MIFIYVPCHSVEAAKKVAKILVEKRMAGRVDIMPTDSVSRVNGGVVEAPGATMIIKTIDKHVQGVEDVVREHHQGDNIACIATIALYRLNREFKDWLIASTGL